MALLMRLLTLRDVMDNSAVSDHIDNLLDQSEKKVRQDAIDRMNAAIRQQSAVQTPANMFPQTSLDGFNQPVAAGAATAVYLRSASRTTAIAASTTSFEL